MSDKTVQQEVRRGGPYAWFVVTLLMLAFAFSMMDRMILSLLVTPMKKTYGLSDVEISILQGVAFTVFYVTCAIPLGVMADRYKRTAIISWCILVWSIVTILCAFTRNFVELFLARAGVGIGEAGLSPSANSLISDYFRPEQLSKPAAFYSAGSILGPALALVGAGAIVDHLIALGTIDLPLLGPWPAWQMTFVLAGLPGILLAIAFRFVIEPRRLGRSTKGDSNLRDTAVYMWQNRGFLAPHFLGCALVALSTLALAFWLPTYMVRAYGLLPGAAGAHYGWIAAISGVAGLGIGGWAADALGKYGVRGAQMVVPLAASVIAMVPLVAATLESNLTLFFVLIAVGLFFAGSILPITPVALLILVPNEKRGQVFAFYLLCIAMAGFAIGPVTVAFVTEHVLADRSKIGLSLALVTGCAFPLASICFYFALTRFRAADAPVAMQVAESASGA